MLCLQGGAEFSAGCRSMDAGLLRLAGAGPVVVVPLAGAPGREYDTAGRNGVRYFRALGAQAVVAPDVRKEPGTAVEQMRRARLLVLPGGSPSRLLDVLRSTQVADVVREVLGRGDVVVGSSAGAMVLCAWTVLPDRRGPDGPQVVPGLGVVPDLLVVPHWSGAAAHREWLRAVEQAAPPEVQVVGLPEESGVLVDDGALAAVGAAAAMLVTQRRSLPLGESWRPPRRIEVPRRGFGRGGRASEAPGGMLAPRQTAPRPSQEDWLP